MSVSNRGHLLKKHVMSFPPSISSERAEIISEYYRHHDDEPIIIKRAKALDAILNNKTIYINEHELIVGNQAPIPRCAEIYPEFSTNWILDELQDFDRRETSSFQIDNKTKLTLKEVLPYWNGKSTYDKTINFLPHNSLDCQKELVFILSALNCGIGHIAVDYQKGIKFGLRSLINESKRNFDKIIINSINDINKNFFYKAISIVCEGAIKFANRYSMLALQLAQENRDEKRKEELIKISQICKKVPEYPAETFDEALQSFWFIHLIINIESNGHSISPGRFDQLMYPYYKRDIQQNIINKDYAKELLENLWIKFNELMKLRDKVSSKAFGGYPLFQNLIVGGLDKQGNDATNELSYLFVDITRDLRLPQPSLSVRWNGATNIQFMEKSIDLVKSGIGMPSFFNDEVIIPILMSLGCPLEDARNYAEVGCVEPQVPGQTEGFYNGGHLNLCKVLEITMNNGINPLTGNKLGIDTGHDFNSFDSFYAAFLNQLNHFIYLQAEANNIIDYVHSLHVPTPFLSCFIDDCVLLGRDIREGGARYNLNTLNTCGLANVADAMAVIKLGVFRDKLLSLSDLKNILKDNFSGNEPLRSIIINNYPKYGNDDDEVDFFAQKIAQHFCDESKKIKNVRGGYFQGALQSVSVHAVFANALGATPDGRKMEMLVADGGCSPAQGRDKKGPTAVIKSVAKLDHYKASGGSLLNIKLHPSLLESIQGVRNLISLIETFFTLKGQHVQFNVVSADTLLDAQKNPDKYPDLLVRVAGFSVYFTTIDKMLQEDIIKRTEHISY